MSFCSDIKDELCKIEEKESSLKLAELYGLVLFGQSVEPDFLKITTENVFVINRLQQLFSELFGGFFDMKETANAYTVTLKGPALERLYRALRMVENGRLSLEVKEHLLHSKDRFFAFMRGALLSGGYLSDPVSSYHFELVTPYYGLSKSTLEVMHSFGIPAKNLVRRSNYVVYIKDSQQIYDLLYIIGARSAAFDLMNVKIAKETNNNNNRMDNCVAYNMDKALNKAVEQVRAIEQIEKAVGLSILPADLLYVAVLRKEHPTSSLTELADLCGGKLSKPSISRKLNKIIEIAGKIKNECLE
ncbi:MAG: DNA-binding protein WhiA [Clostridia bacterium]|nr:DNA-binding protein WhiA [Clostridia bacterium]